MDIIEESLHRDVALRFTAGSFSVCNGKKFTYLFLHKRAIKYPLEFSIPAKRILRSTSLLFDRFNIFRQQLLECLKRIQCITFRYTNASIYHRSKAGLTLSAGILFPDSKRNESSDISLEGWSYRVHCLADGVS